MMNFNRDKLLLSLFSVFAIAIFSNVNFAQSTDIDNPTPLKSRVLIGELVGNSNNEFFYTFTAGPGEVTIMIDVKTSDTASTLDATFISNANSGTGVSASAVHKGSDRRTKILNVAKKKRIIMKLKDFSVSDGTFKITITGAVSLPEK